MDTSLSSPHCFQWQQKKVGSHFSLVSSDKDPTFFSYITASVEKGKGLLITDWGGEAQPLPPSPMVSMDSEFFSSPEGKKASILCWVLSLNVELDASSWSMEETLWVPHWTLTAMALAEITRSLLVLFCFWDTWPKSCNCCFFFPLQVHPSPSYG